MEENNVGKTIQNVAFVLFTLVLLGAVIMLFKTPEEADKMYVFIYLLAVVFGGFVVSILIYGFGEIIDKLTEIAYNTRPVEDEENNEKVECNEKKSQQ